MPRPKKIPELSREIRRDQRPPNFYETITDLDLRVITHRRDTVVCSDGTPRYLPQDLVGNNGKTVVIYREVDRQYAIAGWCPWHDGMFGGRYVTIGGALAWVRAAIEVRAGKRADFRGV